MEMFYNYFDKGGRGKHGDQLNFCSIVIVTWQQPTWTNHMPNEDGWHTAFHKWKQIFSTAIALFPQVASVIKQFILHWQDNLVFYKPFDVIKTKSSKAEGLCSLAPWLYGKESVLNCINSPNWQNPNWWYISDLHIVKRTIACHHRLSVLVWQGRATENNSVACLI